MRWCTAVNSTLKSMMVLVPIFVFVRRFPVKGSSRMGISIFHGFMFEYVRGFSRIPMRERMYGEIVLGRNE